MNGQRRGPLAPAWTAWAIGVMFVVLVFGYQTGFAIMKPDVGAANDLTPQQLGLIGTAYTWTFAIAQLVSGSLLDRVGARRIIPAAIVLLTVGIFGFAVAGNFELLVVSQIVAALGACFGFVGAGFIGGAWFGMAKYGLMFALVQFIASLSASVNQAIFSFAISAWSWQVLLGAMTASGVLLFLASLRLLSDPPAWDETHGWPRHPVRFIRDVLKDVATVIRSHRMWSILAVGAASFGGMLAIGAVWGGDLALARGMSQSQAHLILPACWLGLAVGAPAFAAFSDRIRLRRPLLVASVVGQSALLASALLLPSPNAIALGAIYFLFGFTAGGSMLSFTMAAELVDDAFAGTSAALVNGAQFVAAGVMMFLPGYFLDAHGAPLTLSLASIPAVLLSSIVAAFALPETHRSRQNLRAPATSAN